MGVYSDGSYGAPKGVIYSFPVTCKDGQWSIVQGLSIDEASATKMKVRDCDERCRNERCPGLSCDS